MRSLADVAKWCSDLTHGTTRRMVFESVSRHEKENDVRVCLTVWQGEWCSGLTHGTTGRMVFGSDSRHDKENGVRVCLTARQGE